MAAAGRWVGEKGKKVQVAPGTNQPTGEPNLILKPNQNQTKNIVSYCCWLWLLRSYWVKVKAGLLRLRLGWAG